MVGIRESHASDSSQKADGDLHSLYGDDVRLRTGDDVISNIGDDVMLLGDDGMIILSHSSSLPR